MRGLYLWGAVGRGKTFLVDLFFAALPFDEKLRLHFHRFMGRVHAELAKLEGRADPLREVAAHFASQARVLCLDEFFVTDIGDAMILAGLLQHLFARGVTLVTTSNIEPAQLYRDGLQRAKFLPAIALLKQHCAALQLQSAQDSRLRALTEAGVYFTPLGERTERLLAACFERIAPGAKRVEPEILVNGRGIAVKRRADGVIWFEFDALCEGPRAVADYIELAQSFNTVLISSCRNSRRRWKMRAALRQPDRRVLRPRREPGVVRSDAGHGTLRRRTPARRVCAHRIAADRNAKLRISGSATSAVAARRRAM